MRAIQVSRHGGPEVLELVELPDPEPGPGEVLVAVAVAGVNYVDTYHRSGLYPIPPPFVLGNEGAGTVRAVGSDVTGVAVGDRVAWGGVIGSYAGLAVVPVDKLVVLPDKVTEELGAALMVQGMTAHYLATSTYPIGDGDWALVHAAAGGVGQVLTQIVKLRGGKVLGTTSTLEKAELARGAGADDVTSYEDFSARAREVTNGEGVSVVYDGVGKTTFHAGLDALRSRGLMVLFGQSSGPVPAIDLQQLKTKGSLYVTRPTLDHYARGPEERRRRVVELFEWIETGRLSVRIGGRYPLRDAARAHQDLHRRHTKGKVLLLP